jgi:hypothetical protein
MGIYIFFNLISSSQKQIEQENCVLTSERAKVNVNKAKRMYAISGKENKNKI